MKKKRLLKKGMALLLTAALSAGACIHAPFVFNAVERGAESPPAVQNPLLPQKLKI